MLSGQDLEGERERKREGGKEREKIFLVQSGVVWRAGLGELEGPPLEAL